MWSWDHQNKLKLCQLNNNLVIRFQDYLDPEDYFYTFFGLHKIKETAKRLLEHSIKEDKHALRLIPEFVAEKLKNDASFVVTEDRDNHDYIVAIRSMIDLEGSHNGKKRQYLRHFMQENEHQMSITELDLIHEVDRKNIRKVVEKWGEHVISKNSFNENELKAIDKILSNYNTISTSNIHIVGIKVSDELKAFSIAEILSDEFAMWHYKKADRDIKGLGIALDYLSAKNLYEKGVKNLNHEQDLGVEGLRRAKLAANPVYFLKKYTISLAPKK